MGKPKKVLFQMIKPDEVILSGNPYELLAEIRAELLTEIRAEHHFDVAQAKIALAWKKATMPDVDGHLVLGKCVKASDLQRELVDYDFVIVLNKEVWEDPEFDREKKLALLDHELCHAARAVDSDGEAMIDSKGRPVWRTRKHDIEEFIEIINRHGCWKRDLEKLAESIIAKKKTPLFVQEHTDRLAKDPKILASIDKIATSVRPGGIKSITFSTDGMEPVVIDRAGAARIHQHAQEAGVREPAT